MRNLAIISSLRPRAGEVFAGAGAFGAAQAPEKTLRPARGRRAYCPRSRGFFGFLGGGIAGFGQRDAQLLRDQADGFREGDVLDLLDEAEDVSGNAAAEAVIELARGVDGERRRFLAVEGAEAG